MSDYSDIVIRLKTNWGDVEAECDAADAIEAQAAEILFWKDRMREALKTIKENNDHIAKLEDDGFKYRMALADIQMKAQDILRPIPFQDEEN